MKPAPGRFETLAAGCVLAGALLACNLGKGESPDRPLPTVGVPVPSTTPVLTPEPARPSEPRPAPAAHAEPEPAPAAAAAPDSPATRPATTPPPDAGPPSSGTVSVPATPPDAGDSVNRATQCVTRCQAAFQQCMNAQPEGGLPDLSRCQGVLEGCRVACS